jgi:two-component system chemotaxis response regulator CheB
MSTVDVERRGGERVRVLVVDDSAFARKVIREVLAAEEDIDVVGIARDGLEALEKIATLDPDVITLDLVMPELDGVGVLKALARRELPRVVVVSTNTAESALGIAALEAGAIELVEKPTALAVDQLYRMGEGLVAAVRAAAAARPRTLAEMAVSPAAAGEVPAARTGPSALACDLVVIGASTGGPQAVTGLLAALPAGLEVPVAVVVHIPIGYTAALARRLDAASPLVVTEASDGLELVPGLAVLARAGEHLVIERAANGERAASVARPGPLRARLSRTPAGLPHRPAVDVLFRTAASATGGRVLGVVLTGMGDDGLLGARAIRSAGGRVLAESASTCVVDGMPRTVREAGLATAEAPLGRMPAAILRWIR